jgi:hypothetical protein
MCGRSSATTIFVREAGTGSTSAGAAANKCSNRASNLERGNGLRMDDPAQDKDLRVDGRAQGNGLRADGPVQDNDLRVDGRAQGNGLRADGPVQDNDLPVPDQAAAMRLGTLVLVERPSPKVREVVQVSAAVVAACEVAAFEAAAAASEAAVAVVVAAVVVAADGDRISRSSTMSFSSAISPTASAFIASSITVASAPM